MATEDRKAIIFMAPKRSLYIGRVERRYRRVCAASTLVVSLEDELRFRPPGSRQELGSRSLLVPAGMEVDIDTRGAPVVLGFLDDMGMDLARLAPRMKAAHGTGGGQPLYTGLEHQAALIREAAWLARERPTPAEALAQMGEWIQTDTPGPGPVTDERVTEAIAMIRAHYAENLSVAEIADAVNLSVPRLIQLFKQVTGTPIRRYRLWHRVLATARKLTDGHSLTEAALASGFCDYAQFSRVYRELSGGSPSAAKRHTEIRVANARS